MFGNISKCFTADNKLKKTRLNGKMYNFFVTHEAIDVSDIENIQEHLMEKWDIV